MPINSKTQEKIAITTKYVLLGLAAGTLIGMAFIMPGLARVATPLLNGYRRRKIDEEESLFDERILRRRLKYLKKKKLVEFEEKGEETLIKITENGQKRILRYNFDNLTINFLKHWDHKWRVIIYDVTELKKNARDAFRHKIKSLGFLSLQESVYLIPYPCENEIEYLRQYFSIGSEILYLTVEKLENDQPFRKYFGI
ncbi:MAG: hypothetical protein AAB506_02040 [Patescibacteria group bacterium]